MTDHVPRLHRPRADTDEISDLLDDAKAGKYELPDFQRDLVWTKDDRIKLFDSIYRGFPIGDILLWDPEEPRQGAVRFGPFVPEKRAPIRYLIVDGQQRLATLFGCLLLPDRKPDDKEDPHADWRLAFHVDRLQVVLLPPDAPPEYLPLPVAIDTSRYLKWTRNLPEENREERTQAGDDFSKALRTYRVPYYVVRTKDRELLQEVFERVNNTGRRLDRKTVFDALFPGSQDENDQRIRLETIATELNSKGFGHIKADWLVQAIKAMVGMDPAAEFSTQLRHIDERDATANTPGKTRRELNTIHSRLKQAAAAAIDLLQQAGIRHVAILPYALVFPPLVHFFDRFPDPMSDATLGKLKRFVWLVSISGGRQRHRSTFQRKAASLTRNAKNAEDAVHQLVQISEMTLDAIRAKSLMAHHDWDSGATRLVALALFELAPRELSSGRPLAVWDELSARGGSPFRLLWTSGVGPFATSSVNRIIAMGDDKASSLGGPLEQHAENQLSLELPTDQESPGSIDPAILESHAIPIEAWKALQRGNRLEFLRLREIRMTEVIDDFLRKQLA